MSTSKEHPILFTAPMVRAILEGRKTQTRRVIDFARIARCAGARKGRLFYSATFDSWAVEGGDVDICLVDCPYGTPGDVLWVQEGFRVDELSSTGEWAGVVYRAGGETMKQIPADKCVMPSAQPRDSFLSGRFMPRWASRLDLEVTDVRVERVQDISPADIDGEGIGHAIGGMIEPVADRFKPWPLHWVRGPGVYESIDYCYPCCKKVVAAKQKEDPENAEEYCVDGGWDDCYESDGPRSCSICDRPLGVTYTDYACEEDVGHFLEYGCNLSNPDDCYYLQRVLEAQVWGEGDLADDIRRICWRSVWDSINAPRGYSWESNPYVWVVTFKRKAGA
jgi:hypothetical protein